MWLWSWVLTSKSSTNSTGTSWEFQNSTKLDIQVSNLQITYSPEENPTTYGWGFYWCYIVTDRQPAMKSCHEPGIFRFPFPFTFPFRRHEDLSRSLIKTQNTMIHRTSIQEEDCSMTTGLSDYSLLFPSQSQMLLLSATKKPSSSSNDSRRRLGRNTPMFLVRSCKGFLVNH